MNIATILWHNCTLSATSQPPSFPYLLLFQNVAILPNPARYNLLFETLENAGVELPHPDSVDDEQLSKVLWRLIHSLSLLRVFLHNTDYLSDRELYMRLWHESLREEGYTPPEPEVLDIYHIDYTCTGSEKDLFCYFKFLASEKDRRSWAEANPDYDMPSRENAPYDRDRHLPKMEDWPGGLY